MSRPPAIWLRKTGLLFVICLLSTLPVLQSQAAHPEGLLKEFQRSQLIIVANSKRCFLFDVYIALNPQQRAQGLMHIREMDTYEGMIFLYDHPAEISMWMKNTLIPLDMLFLEGSGRVATIHAGAVPMSEEIIQSGASVSAVLELNAGAVEQFGIAIDDQVIFPASRL